MFALELGFAVPVRVVSQPGSGFNWSLLLASIATFGVIVAIVVSWSSFRSRPEVAFEWMKPDGRDEEWKPNESVTLEPDVWHELHVELYNIGTGSISPLVVNFVAPDWVDICDRSGAGAKQHRGEEVAVDNPPKDLCHWIARTISAFSPAVPVRFEVWFKVNPDAIPAEALKGRRHYVGVAVEGDRFNATGKLGGMALAHDPERSIWKSRTWPGEPKRRSFRTVQARPVGNVRIGPGKRLDRRPIVLAQPDRPGDDADGV